jgi:hypothetical protein
MHFKCKAPKEPEILAMTGDADDSGSVGSCPNFLHSGKRGFDIRREGDDAKRKEKQKKSAEARKIQHAEQKCSKQDKADKKAFKDLLDGRGSSAKAGGTGG